MITAQDRASRVFRGVAGAADILKNSMVRMGGAALLAGGQFGSLNIAVGTLIPAMAGLAVGVSAIKWAEFEAATRRATFAMRLSGLSARETQTRLNLINSALTRASAEGFFNYGEAIQGAIQLDMDLVESLLGIASAIETKLKIPASEAFAAMSQAVMGTKEPLDELVARVGAVVGPATTLEEKFAAIRDRLNEIDPTQVENLAASIKELGAVSERTLGRLGNLMAGIFDVFVATLVANLVGLETNPAVIVGLAVAGAFLFSRFKFIGSGLAGALIGAIGAGLLINFGTNIAAVFNDPEVIAIIGAAALSLGFLVGSKKWLIAGIAAALGMELAPGISSALHDAELSDVLMVAAVGLGIVIGKRIGGTNGLLLGFALASTLTGEIQRQTSAMDSGLRLALMGLGGALGFLIGGPMGAVLGVIAMQTLIEVMGDLFDVDYAMTWWKDKLVALGKAIGGWIISGIASVWKFLEWYAVLASALPPLPDYQHGGIVPGPVGAGVPIMAHAGETVLPAGGITIQLVLDRYVLGEAVVDIIHRTARFKAGMTESSVSSA